FLLIFLASRAILCAPYSSRPTASRHVFAQEDLGRTRLFANRRKPARRRSGPPAGDRHARKGRGSARERAVGPGAPLRGALRSPSGRARALDRGKCDGDLDATDRAGAGVRAVVGRDRAAGRRSSALRARASTTSLWSARRS